MNDLSLATLRRYVVSPDWQTVCVGWRGLSSPCYGEVRLPGEEVRDFAYDCLAFAVDPEDQQALVDIIDADTNGGFWEAISRSGEYLAARSGVMPQMALSKWRYVTVSECFDENWKGEDNFLYSSYSAYSTVLFWDTLVTANSISGVDPMFPDCETSTLRFEQLQSWLAEERQKLRLDVP